MDPAVRGCSYNRNFALLWGLINTNISALVSSDVRYLRISDFNTMGVV
jgi:hypothetical protein